ncbi:MAG TPA: TlpA disulfide reductase family protein [Acidobacteriota bacterium]|jgi:thiol-disulfide isomerase/thioredoxin|nr:TlpA disulfide reductase family protein [Acidobacteriota bacterium]HRR26601.1 TlpA disulfide reductase family protein [Acidobacteriota bacterium]HRR55740.1 TlpA disulfide reductase family protein [Acidobacteriota bacterium]HRV07741.1 TlpA disulfide reductase family protein [Acidobacteriota bacterium]
MLTPALLLWAGLLHPVDEVTLPKIIAEQRGRVVVVNFWATWCGPCREEFPELVDLGRKYMDRGVVLITVSMDEPQDEEAAEAFLEAQGVDDFAYIRAFLDFERFVNAVDPEWIGVLPATFVFDREGRLRFRHYGEAGRTELETEIQELL